MAKKKRFKKKKGSLYADLLYAYDSSKERFKALDATPKPAIKKKIIHINTTKS